MLVRAKYGLVLKNIINSTHLNRLIHVVHDSWIYNGILYIILH